MPATGEGVCRKRQAQPDKSDTPPDVQVARRAAAQHGVVSAAQLRADGLNREAICVRVGNGRLHRTHHGVYAVGHDSLTRDARFMAAVLACGSRAALSHFAGGALWDYLEWDDRWPEVTVAGSAARCRPGLRIHRARSLDAGDITRRHGIPVTSAARTVLDLAAMLPDKGLRRVVRQSQARGHTSAERCCRSPSAPPGTAAQDGSPSSSRQDRRRRAAVPRTWCSTCC